MSQAIPQWARTRAKALAEAEASCDLGNGQNLLALSCYQAALARLIAAHEEPPVDPLLIEARKLCAHHILTVPGIQYTGGHRDNETVMLFALDALRRGMELSKQEPNP